MEIVWSLSRYVLPVVTVVILVKCIMTLLLGHPKEKIYGYIIDMSSGNRYALNMWETSVGRSKSCDIVLPYDSVARSHAVITRRIDGWYIHDLLTRYALRVNGRDVDQKQIIKNGDVIELGKIRFRFEIINDPVQNVGRKTKRAASGAADRSQPVQRQRSAPARNSDSAATRPSGGHYDSNNKPELKFEKKRPVTPPPYRKEQNSFTVETGSRPPQPKRRTRKQPRLVNKESGEVFILCGNEVTIGSSRKCDIRLKGSGAEKFNTLIVLYEDGWAVERENGFTSLNGKEVRKPQLLFDGDMIGIGEARLYYYEM